MRPVLRWTWHMRRRSTAWWAVGVAAFLSLTLAFYPSLQKQSAQLNQSFNQLSGGVKSFVTDTNNLFSPVGYLSSQIFYLLLPLLLAILLIGLGSSLIAREEQDGTIEFLLARPVSRSRLLLGKAASGAAISMTVALVAALFTIGLCKIVKLDVGSWNIVAAVVMSYLLAMLFGSLSFMLTCLGGAIRGLAIGVSAGLLLLSYILSSLEKSIHWLLWPSRLLPYHYFSPGQLLTGHFMWGPLAGFLAAIVCMLLIALRGFQRRDIG